jgi:hypothetical protein
VRARQATVEGQPALTDTQGRRTPSIGPWLVALGLSLVGVVPLALLKRPTETP